MFFRTPALTAVVALIGITANNPAAAQPVVPSGPSYSPFGGMFYSTPVVPNMGVVNGLNRVGDGNMLIPGANFLGGGLSNFSGAGTGTGGYGPWAPYVLSRQPAVFNYRGHWYANYLGHWYPNGRVNGMGALSNGMGGGRLGGPMVFGGSAGGGFGGGFGGGSGFPGAFGGGGGMGGGMGGPMMGGPMMGAPMMGGPIR